jgi:hypothetical protein
MKSLLKSIMPLACLYAALLFGSAAASATDLDPTEFFDFYGVPSDFWTVSASSSTNLNNGSGFFDLILTSSPLNPVTAPYQTSWAIPELTLIFKGSQSGLSDDGQIATMSLDGLAVQVTTVASFTKPDGAQLETSFGSETLKVVSDDLSFFKTTSIDNIASNSVVTASVDRNHPWLSPSGVLGYSLSGSLLGGNFLVPSSDPTCASVLCMPVVPVTATLESIDLKFAVTTVLTPVPEPAGYSLLLAGLLLVGMMVRKRL